MKFHDAIPVEILSFFYYYFFLFNCIFEEDSEIL